MWVLLKEKKHVDIPTGAPVHVRSLSDVTEFLPALFEKAGIWSEQHAPTQPARGYCILLSNRGDIPELRLAFHTVIKEMYGESPIVVLDTVEFEDQISAAHLLCEVMRSSHLVCTYKCPPSAIQSAISLHHLREKRRTPIIAADILSDLIPLYYEWCDENDRTPSSQATAAVLSALFDLVAVSPLIAL